MNSNKISRKQGRSPTGFMKMKIEIEIKMKMGMKRMKKDFLIEVNKN